MEDMEIMGLVSQSRRDNSAELCYKTIAGMVPDGIAMFALQPLFIVRLNKASISLLSLPSTTGGQVCQY